MNIITKSDTKKFIALLKIGLKKGERKEMKNWSNVTMFNETDAPEEYYVSLEFNFFINPEDVKNIISNDLMENEIEELLNK